jgi:molybdate transport system substrate-binding protein
LRGALTKIVKTVHSQLDCDIQLEFGPSGVLKERIENGEHADLFISANLSHPQELLRLGLTEKIIPVAKNEVCLFGHFSPGKDLDGTIDIMLDPSVGLGTSTPGDDPGGDYAFEVFRLVDAIRPGSYAVLSAKALQLVGGRNSPPTSGTKHPVLSLFAQQRIDIFLGYYTTALAIKSVLSSIHIERLPEQIVGKTDYAMVKTICAHDLTTEIIDIILSRKGNSILEKYGFQGVFKDHGPRRSGRTGRVEHGLDFNSDSGAQRRTDDREVPAPIRPTNRST